jgi:low affinity Fe/Cu permease
MYENFSFLVNMLAEVFGDLAFFLTFFGIVIWTFSLMILVLTPSVID